MKHRSQRGVRRWWARFNVPMVAAGLATVFCALVYSAHAGGAIQIPGLNEFERNLVDVRFRMRGERAPLTHDIVVVGLDDRTREEAPDLFQMRRGWARLLRGIAKHRPLAVGLDVFYASPEVAIDPQVVAQVRDAETALKAQTDPPRTPAAEKALAALTAVMKQTEGDDQLAKAIADAGNIYLGTLFFLAKAGETPAAAGTYEPEGLKPSRYGEGVEVSAPASKSPPKATGAITSLPRFTKGAAGAGALNVSKDPDGHARRISLVLSYAGRFYMPLGMVMAKARLRMETNADVDTSYVTGDQHVGWGDGRLPVTRRGEAVINFLGRKPFPHISAADVVNGKVPSSALAGKLVFVGLTDTARDKIATPFGTQLNGVDMHATLAHNILHGELMTLASPTATIGTILMLGFLLTLVQLRRLRKNRGWIPPAAAVLVVLGYLVTSYVMFRTGTIVEIAAPVASCIFIVLASLSAVAVTEGREKRAIRAMFSKYLSRNVVDKLIANPNLVRLGGERRELTVLFSDIRGFSRFSERLEPEVLSDYLNEYLTPMTDLVFEREGMLDKYIGDAIMAVFGAPVEHENDAARACETSLRMIEGLKDLNARWAEEDLPQIAIGVGLNSGPMAVGNMGSEALFDYTVMGDAVNLGARLEGLTKLYRVNVLCGERTKQLAGDGFVFRELDWVRVKGRDAPALIYELMGRKGEVKVTGDALRLFDKALAAYRDGEWDEAATKFRHFLKSYPDDGPAKVMLGRIESLDGMPPATWDGVFDQLFK